MVIYGTALLAFCLLAGLLIGQGLGSLLGTGKDFGGVGIAMLLLILSTQFLRRHGKWPEISERGVTYWSAIYIPVTVAMAASQNVVAALEGGFAALLAGTLAVVLSFALVPLLSKWGKGGKSNRNSSDS